MNRKNYAVTVVATTKPTTDPKRSELIITAYCSYMNDLIPCILLKPIALRHPYSQTFSRTFYVVEIRSKKNAKINAITPIKELNIENNCNDFETDFNASFMSNNKVRSSLKYDLIPSANWARLSSEIVELSLTNTLYLGMSFVKL